MLTKTLEIKKQKLQDDGIVIFILNLGEESLLCGRTMVDWVKKATSGFPTVEFDYDGEELIKFLTPRLVNSKYVIVLFSNTPLITQASVLKIMEYVKFKEIKACKFNGGFAFDVEYLKSAKEVRFDSYLPLDSEDFIVVDSKSKMLVAGNILKTRIIQKHTANGVEFLGNCEIDDQVNIGKNVVIFGGNIIKGDTIIGNNTILKENNVIENCVIGEDVCISSSTITNSQVEDNVFILPYCFVMDSTIRKNCYISSNVKIEKRTIRKGSRL